MQQEEDARAALLGMDADPTRSPPHPIPASPQTGLVSGSVDVGSIDIGGSGDGGAIRNQQLPPSPSRSPPKSSPVTKSVKKRKVQNIIQQPWTPPDWKQAEKFANFNQPRKGGNGGTRFELLNTTSGRHCYIDGCGEQFDVWAEGKVSEFSIYGSGVTNYFKFIKWMGWVLLLCSLITLPELVLNIYGPNVSNKGLRDIAQTTIGNLASGLDSSSGSLSIHIPGCYDTQVYNINCDLSKANLSAFFSKLDICVGIFFFLSFLWLRKFEKEESNVVDSTTGKTAEYRDDIT